MIKIVGTLGKSKTDWFTSWSIYMNFLITDKQNIDGNKSNLSTEHKKSFTNVQYNIMCVENIKIPKYWNSNILNLF